MYNMYKVARSEAVGLIRVKLVVCMIVLAVCRIGSPSMSRLRWNRWCAMRSWGEPGLSLSSGVAQARIEAAGRSFDRFLSLYVFVLLAQEYALAIVREAARVLEPGGLLCLVSLTWGDSVLSRGLSRLCEGLWSANPKMVGGCRPVELFSFVEPAPR